MRAIAQVLRFVTPALALVAIGSLSEHLWAQALPTTISPLQVEPDRNGVNLATGKMAPEAITLSIPAAPRLKFDRIQNAAPYITGEQHKVTGETEQTGEWTIHTADGVSEAFRCAWDIDDGKICSSVTGTGSALAFSGGYYRKTGTGEKYILSKVWSFTNPPPGTPNPRYLRVFYVSSIEYPDGEVITYSYDSPTPPFRPIRITTNKGYFIKISYQGSDISNGTYFTPGVVAIYKETDQNTPLAQVTYFTDGSAQDLAGRIYQGMNGGTLSVDIEQSGFSQTLPTEAAAAVMVTPTSLPGGFQMVAGVTRDAVPWSYSYTSPTYCLACGNYQYSAVTANGPNNYHKVYTVESRGSLSGTGVRNMVTKITDELNQFTSFDYDAMLRLTKITAPEGNKLSVTYDLAGNVDTKTRTGKTGSTTTEQSFVDLTPFLTPTGSFTDCLNTVKCWRPDWFEDALDQRTNFTYNSLGQVTQQLAPPDQFGVRRQTDTTYTLSPAGLSRKTLVRVCGGATCSGFAESRTEFTYWGETELPLTVTEVDESTGERRTTTYAYDEPASAGRVTMIDGPVTGTGDAKYFRYDTLGRKTWEIGEAALNGTRIAKKFTYRDADDKVINVQNGTLTSPTDTNLVLNQQTDTTYDSRRYGIREKTYNGPTVYRVTDRSYLDRGLLDCTTIRMNFAALPAATATGACALGTTSPTYGPDRITKNLYDTVGRVTTIQKAFGVTTAAGFPITLQQDYATYTYTVNGKQQFVTDANGNKAQFKYDQFDRLQCWIFPSKNSVGTVSGDCVTTGDYESYSYDAADNRLTLRKRDASIITFDYDGLNRVKRKVIPPRGDLIGSQTRDVFFDYDAAGRQTKVRFDAVSGPDGIVNKYNGFGDPTESTVTMGAFSKTITSHFDGGGRRDRVTHPDGPVFSYAFDDASKLTGVYEGAGTSTPLDTFAYYNTALIQQRTEGAGASKAIYQWDDIGRLTNQSDTFATPASNVAWAFADYNPASQIRTETRDNDQYAYGGLSSVNVGYQVNGLNQYTSTNSSAGGATVFGYDSNGNLTGDGAKAYTYDIENRLVKAVVGGTTTNLVYDPLGRLFQIDQGSTATTTNFVYDGDAMVLEYNGAGAIANRYVHGSNAAADDPLVAYAGTSLASKSWLHADHLGSIVAVTNASGGSPAINKYDEYGVPQVNASGVNINTGKFQYTGQVWLGELGVYYYKARMYSPGLGRFMQVDPVGYDDQVNLYAYPGNDPINMTDPTGTTCTTTSDGKTAQCKIDNPSASLLADQKKGGTKLQTLEAKYTATVNKLLSDRSKSVTIAKIGEVGSRLTREYKTTQGEMADKLIAATVSVYDKPTTNPETGKVDPYWKADAVDTPTGPRIGLYPRAFVQGMSFEKTLIHESTHLTQDGANLYRDFSASGQKNFGNAHQGAFDRLENEVWGK